MGRSPRPDAKGNAPRLFNHDQEISGKTNLAASHAGIAGALTALGETIMAEIGGPDISPRRAAGKQRWHQLQARPSR